MNRQLMLWETEVAVAGEGAATVRARRPVLQGDVRRVLAIFGMEDTPANRKTVHELRRAGKICGWKPGAMARPGRESNAKVVFDLESCYRWRDCGMKGCS